MGLLATILTGDADWDPAVLDLNLDDNETWFEAISDLPLDKPPLPLMSLVITQSRLLCRVMMFCIVGILPQHMIEACVMAHTYQAHSLDLSHPPAPNPEDPALDILPTLYESHAHEINKHAPNYQSLQPMFGWLPADVIKQTFEVTTQCV